MLRKILQVVLVLAGMFVLLGTKTPANPELTDEEWDFYRTAREQIQTRDTASREAYHALRGAGVSRVKAERLAPVFEHYAGETGTDAALLVAIASVESDFTAGARSPAGAIGMMQVVPDRRAWGKYESRCGAKMTRHNLLEPEVNICFGAHILAWFREHHGSRRKALNAYNNGTGRANGYAEKVLHTMQNL